jgi:hypothetical protein
LHARRKDTILQLAFKTAYGGEFLVVTLHLWGSVGAVLGLAWVRRRTAPLMSVRGLLLLVVGSSLLITSVRWFHDETFDFFRKHGLIWFAHRKGPDLWIFQERMDHRVLFLASLAFLGALTPWLMTPVAGKTRGRGLASIGSMIAHIYVQSSRWLVPLLLLGFAIVLLVRQRSDALALEQETARQRVVSARWNKLVRENENRRIRIIYLEAIAENGSASVQDRYLRAVADPETASIQDRLPGAFVPLESACKRSSIIAVAAFRTSSYHEIEWNRDPGQTEPLTGTLLGTLTMKKMLRGGAPAERTLEASITVAGPRRPPHDGEAYIYFVQKTRRGHSVIKVLPVTEENIRDIDGTNE